jgi:hypothetical protein
VISKVCARGRRVQGLLYYLFTEGRAGEKSLSSDHHNPRVIAGFDDPSLLQPEVRPDGRRDFRRLTGLLTQPLQVAGVTPDDRPVYHLVASAAKDPHTGQLRDRLLSDVEWADIAQEYLHQLGFAKRGDEHGARWIAVRHADDHIHILATLARQDGKRVHPHNDYYTVRRASHAIEARYGLTSTAPADRTAAKRPTRAETEKLARTRHQHPAHEAAGPALTDRERLRRHVRTAAAGSRDLHEFLARLEHDGVHVRLRYSEQNPDQVTGYAVALPQPNGQPPVWFGGGKLASDLTLPQLQHRFSGADARGQERLARGRQWTAGSSAEGLRARHRARVVTSPLSPGERARAWKQATVAATRATEDIARCARTDPAGAADAAWAAADLLTVAAQLVEGRAGGTLTDAAEAYDRAARELHGRHPVPTSAGHALRHAASALLDAGLTAQLRRTNPELAALLDSLTALVRAVSDLRETQARLAQAQAASLAAGRLARAAAAAAVDVEPSGAGSSMYSSQGAALRAIAFPEALSPGVPSAPSAGSAWRVTNPSVGLPDPRRSRSH